MGYGTALLVGKVHKPQNLEMFGSGFYPRGPRMAAPYGTSNGIAVVPRMAVRRDLTWHSLWTGDKIKNKHFHI